MSEAGLDPHRDLVQFLRDQDELAQLLLGPGPAKVFDLVVKTKPHLISIGDGSRIDDFVKLEGGKGLTIGCYVHVASFAHLNIGGGELILEDFTAIASGARIISGSNQLDALTMSACAPQNIQRVHGSVTRLKKYACVLCNGVVLPGVTLHEGAVLAAGGVATRDIPEWEVWGGVPARFMSKRVVR